jgi:hypothetical protein
MIARWTDVPIASEPRHGTRIHRCDHLAGAILALAPASLPGRRPGYAEVKGLKSLHLPA